MSVSSLKGIVTMYDAYVSVSSMLEVTDGHDTVQFKKACRSNVQIYLYLITFQQLHQDQQGQPTVPRNHDDGIGNFKQYQGRHSAQQRRIQGLLIDFEAAGYSSADPLALFAGHRATEELLPA